MTPEEWADELTVGPDLPPHAEDALCRQIADAIRAAVAEERKACAKIASGRLWAAVSAPDGATWGDGYERAAQSILDAIRERGEAGSHGMNGAKVQGG